jgi:hypothetical protein
MDESIGIKGCLKLENITTGQVVKVPNTIMNIGFSTISALAGSGITTPNKFGWMALGIGSSTVAATDTTLGSQYLKIVTANSQTTTTVTNDTLTMIGSFTVDATKTINEAGLFNASGLNTGSMLARTCFANILAISGDNVNATWAIKFS